MSDSNSDNPSNSRILIDEDWKTQVQAEKEKLSQNFEDTKESAKTQPASLPPASFSFLVSTLSTQAMIAMGAIPNPLNNETDIRLDQAKHFIDTLSMLDKKTEGNLTKEESDLMQAVLHELRLGFLNNGNMNPSKPESDDSPS
ncbi:MAG: DUF1844 domain-containing protein [Planctomycetota bacterium]|nr:DUF1844 domain-containing protein [Planctomycetota bacterium]